MLDFYEALPRVAVEVLFISVVGWLGLWLFVRSVGVRHGAPALGGPYTFLTLWSLAILATFHTQGRAFFAIHALFFAILAIGCVTWLITWLARIFTGSSSRRGGPGDQCRPCGPPGRPGKGPQRGGIFLRT